jgi:hypothetical protein
MKAAVVAPTAIGATAIAAVGYAWAVERKAIRLRRHEVPVLPPGAPPHTVLHVTD